MTRSPEPAILDRLQTEYLAWSAYVEGEPKPLADPIPLRAAERDEVASICERFAALIARTADLALADDRILDAFSLPPGVRRLVEAERGRPGRAGELLARYDVFRTPEGWKLSEFNTDVPGGLHEASGLADLVAGDPKSCRVLEAATDLACRDLVRPSVGIVYASGFGEDLEQCQFLRRAWIRRGIPAILGGAANLAYDGRRLRLLGQPIDVLYRFFPAEWLDGIPAAEGLRAAVKDGAVRLVNPFAQLVAQTKIGMAFWWERRDLLTAAERGLVERHLPRTERFDARRLDEYRARRDEIVVKRSFGRVGEQVLVGRFHSDADWADALGWPLSEPGQWIVQERFETLPVELGGGTYYPCYGAYVVANRFEGFYVRAAREPFIASDAYTAAVKVMP